MLSSTLTTFRLSIILFCRKNSCEIVDFTISEANSIVETNMLATRMKKPQNRKLFSHLDFSSSDIVAGSMFQAGEAENVTIKTQFKTFVLFTGL